MIPLVNLERQFLKIKDEVLDKIEEVCISRHFINGKFLSEFERKFTEVHDNMFGCGSSNGTTALFLALRALGITEGDEVITTPHTFIATAEAICHVGAKPVFVDIDPYTYTIDVKKIENAITKKTKAILPVHIYGNPCDMNEILKIAKRNNLYIIEDCAQAHLAEYYSKKVGTFGDAAAFSFFPGKNLGAFGDAGFVLGKSKEMEVLIRKLTNHGRVEKYKHELIGYNYRMDDLQAAILSIKLKYLEEWTNTRIKRAQYYNSLLKKNGFMMQSSNNIKSVYHLYVVQVSNRYEVLNHLRYKGIAASIHYPIPLHLQPAFSFLGYTEGDFPIAERAANRVISLPLCSEITESEIEYICDEFLKVAKYEL